jgi:sorting nexin-1/2
MDSAAIVVSGYDKRGDGINAYISYTVKVKTADGEEEVERRYNDFDWLHQHLSAEFSGLVIPPLPEKQVSGRFSAGFVEGRRRALERFLNRTAAHEELHRSEHFRTFLQADSHAMRATKGADKPGTKKPRGPMKWFSDAAAAVSNFGGASSARKTEADLEFEAVSEYIDRLEPQMQALFKHTQTLVRRGRDTAQGLFEFGLAFNLLSQSEQGRLRHGLEQMGETADQLSVRASEQADEEALAFEEPIHDYIRIVGAVKAALSSRHEKRLAYQGACADLQSKESALSKATGQSAAGPKRAQLQAEAQRAQGRVAETREEFEVVSARVLREVQRFNDSKRADFKTIVCDMVQLQIEHAQKVEAAWQSLIPDLESIQDEQQE